jgi:hypothetical protein
VTLTDLIPALRGPGSRRAVDKVADLRDENQRLLTRQMAADDFFAVLMNDVTATNAAWEQEKRLRGEAEEAAAQMRMERDDAIDEREAATAEAEYLRQRLAPFLAAEANANPIYVPPMVRDTSAIEDQATGPIDVRALWHARDAGFLGPVLDPGQAVAPLTAPCPECLTQVPAGTPFCSARCRNAADRHDDLDGDL